MSSQDETPSTAKLSHERMPPALERQLLIAVAEHRRQYGSKHYPLLREHPDFEPWIGKRTGETGRKRLQRVVKRVSKRLPEDRTRPHKGRDVNDDQVAWAEERAATANAGSGVPIVVSPAQIMAGGGLALTGFVELARMLKNGPADLELVRQAALADDPDGAGKFAIDPELLLKAIRAQSDWVDKVERLSARFASVFATTEFAEGVVQLITVNLAHLPEERDATLQDLNDLVRQLGGLPATTRSFS